MAWWTNESGCWNGLNSTFKNALNCAGTANCEFNERCFAATLQHGGVLLHGPLHRLQGLATCPGCDLHIAYVIVTPVVETSSESTSTKRIALAIATELLWYYYASKKNVSASFLEALLNFLTATFLTIIGRILNMCSDTIRELNDIPRYSKQE